MNGVYETGVVVGFAKHDESTTKVIARAIKIEGHATEGIGPFFFLKNPKSGNAFIWENDVIEGEKLVFGSLFAYGSGDAYDRKIDVKPQDVDAIKMSLQFGESAFAGIIDAFPSAKCHQKGGVSIDEIPTPSICAVSMKKAFIKDEQLYFTTCRGEKLKLKLQCRRNLHVSTSSIELQVDTSGDDNVGDVALVTFESQHTTRHRIYWAVCVGLILKFRPTVISIDQEPVKIRNGNGEWVDLERNVLFDTGNSSATAISEKLVEDLNLEPDRSKRRKVEGMGGINGHFSTVDVEIKVRNHKFPVNASVGATASCTDLLIGTDIISWLIEKNYTLGE